LALTKYFGKASKEGPSGPFFVSVKSAPIQGHPAFSRREGTAPSVSECAPDAGLPALQAFGH
jgi:hypothetical protein